MNLARYRFVLSRPLQLLPVLFGISLITFVLVRSIPGDPARALLGSRSTPDALLKIRAQYGLDQPLWLQYFYFLKNLLKGDLGQSLLYKVDALKLIVTRIEPTLVLVLGSVVLALLIAVPLATWAARNKGGWADNLIRVFTTVGLGMPAFWLGLMLILLLSVKWGLFPVSGYGRTWLDKAHHMVLPCLTIALALSAVLVRNLRASMLMELQADHVTAARARGLSEARSVSPACVAQFPGAGGQPAGSEYRLADQRHGGHRKPVRHSWHRSVIGARHLYPRLHGGAGRGHGVGLRDGGGQLHRGSGDGGPRPAGENAMSSRPLIAPWRLRLRFGFRNGRLTAAWGLLILLVWLALALFAPWIAPFDPIAQNTDISLLGSQPGPSIRHR